MQKINKRGAIQGTLIVVGIFALVGLVAFMMFQGGLTGQVIGGLGDDETLPSQQCADSTTSLTFPAVNKLNKGTSVTTTSNARVNGAPSTIVTSSTTFTVGDTVELMHNATSFVNTKLEPFTVTCGMSQAPTAEIYATSTNTFKMFNDNGDSVSDETTGTSTNLTGSSSQVTGDLRIQSTVDESTSDLLIIFETNDTEANTITLTGPDGIAIPQVTVPKSHAEEFSGDSLSVAFKVPEALDGAQPTYTFSITAESGKTLGPSAATGTPLYVTALPIEWFIDTDGSYTYGVENADGTAKHETSWDFDATIGST